MILLGIDLGSSSVKAALADSETGRALGSAQSPASSEMTIDAPHPGWAEQDPETWWTHTQRAVRLVLEDADLEAAAVGGIGISYQMHGLVLTGGDDAPLRPSIIWCDGRAARLGAEAFREMGERRCLRDFLNSPGNFTASKLAWVRENEPEVYAAARHAMLPGDWLAYRMTGDARTTASGLSEAVLWHMREDRLATEVLDHYGLDADLVPERVPTFGVQGRLTAAAALALGLEVGTPVAYRAGDQPNNALSLGVLE
ncbi:FGGY family carbohydrate kinase, partial [Rubrivirga sp.]|uniref:FGGY family carbohydrate kinase n=1 Tax=Rubrivirga sp. TaxID=1885344 RepID=UPI003C708017